MLVPVSAPSLAELAAGSLLLEGLRPAEIDNIVAAATRRHVRAQAVITRQGTSADHLYMLVKGRAHYFIDTKKGQKLLMMWVVPGGLIGGAAVTLKIMNYVASTRAVRFELSSFPSPNPEIPLVPLGRLSTQLNMPVGS